MELLPLVAELPQSFLAGEQAVTDRLAGSCPVLLTQLAGAVASSAAANGMEVDGQQQQQGRKLYLGSQELGYKRPNMEVRAAGFETAPPFPCCDWDSNASSSAAHLHVASWHCVPCVLPMCFMTRGVGLAA